MQHATIKLNVKLIPEFKKMRVNDLNEGHSEAVMDAVSAFFKHQNKFTQESALSFKSLNNCTDQTPPEEIL